MTRINSAITVRRLTDEHLLAEHREIKRLPACFVKSYTSGALKIIPKEYMALGEYDQETVVSICSEMGFYGSVYPILYNKERSK